MFCDVQVVIELAFVCKHAAALLHVICIPQGMITIVTSGGVEEECGEDQIIMEESIIQEHGHETGK